MRKTVNILGVRVNCVNFDQTLAHIHSWIESPQSTSTSLTPSTHQICTVNPEFIIDARRDPAFARVLHKSSLCVPDGVGVIWAAKRVGVKLGERVTGSDGIYRISEHAAKRGWRIFLLGAAPGIAQRAATILQELYPDLLVVGTCSGTPTDGEWPEIKEQLWGARPDILFVAFGHPKQDFWIAKHRDELPAKVAIGVGGAFDFVAGVLPRAPLWMQRLGLEWLYRLLLQPSRIRRMMKLPVFVGLVVKEKWLSSTA